ncbi:MAG: hypothetical protein JSR64_17050 [Nitrospira sp.]|nr:hypothetical protein [Nitrospira sp.]
MSASGFIGTPSVLAPASPSGYRAITGGPGGSVATPSRVSGVATAPPPLSGGANGPVANRFPVVSRNNPFPLHTFIYGSNVTHFVRKFFVNAAGTLRFVTTGNADTTWSTNQSGSTITESDPNRLDARFGSATFRQEFDTRLQTVYTPMSAVQRNQFLDVSTAKSDYRMAAPYFNRMTQYKMYSPYAATTEVLQ